ncbi:MAG: cohesin domain-containing protein [Euryarchaeota archaeon]|nr:cohesin domain-containing protein [Euryarchaeota archaeon]
MNKQNILRLLVPVILLVLATAVASLPAAAATISIDDASAAQGATTTTPIGITQLTEQLGAATIVVEYDSDVKVVSVTSGTMGDPASANINNAEHKTIISWFSTAGVTGNQTFAYVELEAIGDSGEGGPLELTVDSFVITKFDDITHVVDNGWLSIGDGVGGDTTIADVILALQLAASGEWNASADVDGNGKINSLDALKILQMAAGNINRGNPGTCLHKNMMSMRDACLALFFSESGHANPDARIIKYHETTSYHTGEPR